MADEPVRSRTMQAVAAQLGTITEGVVVYPTKSVTYWTTPSLVTRSLLFLTQYDQPLVAGVSTTRLDQGPVIGVVRSSGSTFDRLLHVPANDSAMSAFQHQQRLAIWGYVKGTDDLIAADALERLWQDCVECLLVDPTLGGAVLDSRPEGTLDTDDGEAEPLAMFSQGWLVVA